jgi:2-amino-4-hydroxy-6-hydroxymethyldihydropteridine diphosphokinase
VPILPGSRSAPHDEDVVLALGGDLAGDYPSLEALLEAALSSFPRAGLRIVRRSGWWRSAAWPDPTQPAYLNAVAIVETTLSPNEVLAAIHALEAEFGRNRSAPNAPRTLDIDLIGYGRQVMDAPGVSVPHPRAAERRFVMGPLAEIAPDWVHPTLGKTAAELAAAATVGADAQPVATRRNVESGHSGET